MKYYLKNVGGKHYIFADVNFRRYRIRISTGYSIEHINQWDDRNQKLKKTAPSFITINNHLLKIKSGVENRIADLKINKSFPTEDQ